MKFISLFFMMIGIISLVLLTGCQSDAATPPPSSFVDRSMVDYSFVDITDTCSIKTNINITYYTENQSATPCTGGQKELYMYYSNTTNWTVMCCDYNEKCVADQTNITNYDNICSDSNIGKYTGYVYSDNGFWMAQCCDDGGDNCYVDLNINITDDNTICNEDYHQNTYSIDFNGTAWNGMCCIGGLEE